MALNIGTLIAVLRMVDEVSPVAEKVRANARKLGSDLKEVGSMATIGLTAPLVGVGAAGLKMSTDLNRALGDVQSLLGGPLEESTARVAAMKGELQGLGIETGKSSVEMTEGLYEIVSAIGDTSDKMQLLQINAKAAAAGKADLTSAVKFTTAVTKTFGDVSAEATQKVADLGFQAVNIGQTTFPQLAGAIGRVAPLAKETGVSMEEMFAIIATATGVTGDTNEVMTQMAAAITALVSPSEGLQEIYGKLGVKSGEALIQQRGLVGALQAVAQGAKEADKPLIDLLGRKEAWVLTSSLAGSQAQKVAENMGKMGQAAGAADAAFKAQTQGINAAGFTWDQLKQKVAVALEQLGDRLVPIAGNAVRAIEPLVGIVMRAVELFGNLPQPLQLAAFGFFGMVAAAGPLLFITGQLIQSFGILAGSTALGAVSSAVRSLGNSVPVLTARLWLMEASAKAVGLALAKVGLAAAGVYAAYRILSEAHGLLSDKQAREASAAVEQARRYDMKAKASEIAGRSILDYAEAVEIVTAQLRTQIDAEARAVTSTQATGTAAATAAAASKTLTQRLADTQRAVAALTGEQRGQLNSGIALGLSTEKLTEDMNRLFPSLKLTEHATALYKEQVEKGAAASKKAAEETKKFQEAVDYFGVRANHATYNALVPFAASLSDAAAKGDIAAATQEELASTNVVATRAIEEAWRATGKYATAVSSATTQVKDLNDRAKEAAYDGLQSFFTALGQIAGSNGIGKFLQAAGNMVAGLKSAHTWSTQLGMNGQKLGGSFGPLSVLFNENARGAQKFAAGLQTAAGVAQGAHAIWQATAQSASKMQNALSGAMAGAQAGAMFGPWGVAIGAAAGLVVGIVRGKPAWAKAAEEVGRDFGVKISDELGKAIAATAKELFKGDRFTAAIHHLKDIIKEAGGLNALNFDQMAGRLHDVFSLIERGQMSIAQGATVINENWSEFVRVGTDGSGRLSAKLREIIQLNDRMGVQSTEIAKYLQDQASAAISGFNAVVASETEGWLAIGARVVAAQKAYDDLAAKGEVTQKAIDDVSSALRAQQDAARTADQQLADLGVQALAVFGAAVASGKDFASALREAQPGLRNLSQAYQSLGLDVDDAALKALLLQSTILDNNPALIQGIAGLSQSFIALSNMGLLNVDTFEAMQRTGIAMYTRLQASVAAAGGTTRDALLPMQSYLQQAAEQARLLGIPLDDNTQMLIDQSKELGLWKDKGKSANDLLIAGFQTLADKMGELISFLRGDLPAGFGASGRAGEDAARGIGAAFRNHAIPALRDTAEAINDTIEMKSPTGLLGIVHYTKLAADEMVKLRDRSVPALVTVRHAVDDIATRFDLGAARIARSPLGRTLSDLTGKMRTLAREAANIDANINPGGGALAGKLRELQRAVSLGKRTGLSKDLLDFEFRMSDEISQLGPDPSVYRHNFELARQAIRQQLQYMLEDLEDAKQAELKALGPIPEAYEKEYARAMAAAERANQRAIMAAENYRRREMADLDDLVRYFDGSYEKAQAYVQAEYEEMLRDAADRFQQEKDSIGPMPAEYAEIYAETVRRVETYYARMKQRAQEKTDTEIAQLGPIPDQYEQQYGAAVELVKAKYALMVEAAAKAAQETVDAWKIVEDMFTRVTGNNPGIPGGGANIPVPIGQAVEQIHALFRRAGFQNASAEHLAEIARYINYRGGDTITALDLNRAMEYIRRRFRELNIPGFDQGTHGLRDFGRGTMVMLHGREEVRTEAQARGDSGQGVTQTIIVNLDGRQVARTVVRHMPSVLAVQGVRQQ